MRGTVRLEGSERDCPVMNPPVLYTSISVSNSVLRLYVTRSDPPPTFDPNRWASSSSYAHSNNSRVRYRLQFESFQQGRPGLCRFRSHHMRRPYLTMPFSKTHLGKGPRLGSRYRQCRGVNRDGGDRQMGQSYYVSLKDMQEHMRRRESSVVVCMLKPSTS
jgi:hypothetical protein